jgi:hypothetical protein
LPAGDEPSGKRLGVAQFGSVLEWGSRGRKFKSSHPDHRKKPDFIWFFSFYPTSNLCSLSLIYPYFDAQMYQNL